MSNEIFSHTDMLPTLLAAAGDPDIVAKLKQGHQAGGKIFKVHIDGFNLIPFLKGEVKENPRKGFLYWSDDGDLMALRVGNWKMSFLEQPAHGMDVWLQPAQAFVVEFLKTFVEFPPRQRPSSFSVADVLERARRQEEAMLVGAGGPR